MHSKPGIEEKCMFRLVKWLCMTGTSFLITFALPTEAHSQNATFQDWEDVQRNVVGRYERVYVVEITNQDSRVFVCNINFSFRAAPGGGYRTSSVNQGVYPGRTQQVTLRGYYSGTVRWTSRCRY